MNLYRTATRVVVSFALLAAATLAASGDEAGVSADAILFGQAAALEGPSSALGQRMRQGIVAAFTEINSNGGVHGRRLQLISRDDGYDPDRSVAQTLRLIEDDKVFALIGAVGTPTAKATISITSARNVPFIGPFSGAEFLRDLELPNVVNIRASYGAEAEAWIKHLTEDRHFTRIGIFYQDDSFGRDGLAGVKNALAKRGLELAAEGTFERNTRAVGSAWRMIKRAEPEAIVMVGTLRALRRIHQAGTPQRPLTDLRQHLLRRRQCARARTRPRWRRCHRLAGGAVSLGSLAQARRRLPGGAEGVRPDADTGLRVARRLSLRPLRRRGAGTSRAEPDAGGPDADHQRRRPLRHQRQHHHRRHPRSRNAAKGVFDGNPEGRNVQGGGPVAGRLTAAASNARR